MAVDIQVLERQTTAWVCKECGAEITDSHEWIESDCCAGEWIRQQIGNSYA